MQTRRRTPTSFELMFFLLLLDAAITLVSAAGNSTDDSPSSGGDDPLSGDALTIVIVLAVVAGIVGGVLFLLRKQLGDCLDRCRDEHRAAGRTHKNHPLYAQLVKLLGLPRDEYHDANVGRGAEFNQWMEQSLCAHLVGCDDRAGITAQALADSKGVAELLNQTFRAHLRPGADDSYTSLSEADLERVLVPCIHALIDYRDENGAALLVHEQAQDVYDRVNEVNREIALRRLLFEDVVFDEEHYLPPVLSVVTVVPADQQPQATAGDDSSAEKEDSGQQVPAEKQQFNRVALETLFNPQRRRIMLSGVANSGKSTFMSRVPNAHACALVGEGNDGQPLWNGMFRTVMRIPKNFLSFPNVVEYLRNGEVEVAIFQLMLNKHADADVDGIRETLPYICWSDVLLMWDGVDQLDTTGDNEHQQAIRNLKGWLFQKPNVMYASRSLSDDEVGLYNATEVTIRGTHSLAPLVNAFVSGDEQKSTRAIRVMRDSALRKQATEPGVCELFCYTETDEDVSDVAEPVTTTAQHYQKFWRVFSARWIKRDPRNGAHVDSLHEFLKELASLIYREGKDFATGEQVQAIWGSTMAATGLDAEEVFAACTFLRPSFEGVPCFETGWEFGHHTLVEFLASEKFVDGFVIDPEGEQTIAKPEKLNSYTYESKLVWQFIAGILGSRSEHEVLERFFIWLFFDEKIQKDKHPGWNVYNGTAFKDGEEGKCYATFQGDGNDLYVTKNATLGRGDSESILALYQASGLMYLPKTPGNQLVLTDEKISWRYLQRWSHDFSVNEQRFWGITFWQAVEGNYAETAYRLLDEASQRGFPAKDVIQEMLPNGAGGPEKLHHMVRMGNVTLIEFVLRVAEVDIKADIDHYGPLIYSSVDSELTLDTFDYFVSQGAEFEADKLLTSAVGSDSEIVLDRVLRECEQQQKTLTQKDLQKAFYEALRGGNYFAAQWLIGHGLVARDIARYVGRDGMPHLYVAMVTGNFGDPVCLGVVNWLIETAGVKPESQTNKGETPFFYAVKARNELAARFLVNHYQVNPKAVNNDGETALFEVCRDKPHFPMLSEHDTYFHFDRKQMVRFLLTQGLSFNDENKNGKKPEDMFDEYNKRAKEQVDEARAEMLSAVVGDRDVETGDADAANGAAEEKKGADGERRVPDAAAGASALGQFGGQGRSMGAPLGNAPVYP